MNWLKKLLRIEATPLPTFPRIRTEQIPAASILLFYGGTPLTEIAGNYIYKHPYRPAAFHAAGFIGKGEVLNVNKTTTIENILDMRQSTRRIDVIVLTDLTDEEREIICSRFRRDAGKNFYDGVGYLRFGGKLKILRFLKKIKASEKDDFCSDNVVDNIGALEAYRRSGDSDEVLASLRLSRAIPVSAYPAEDSAPWHLLEHALTLPDIRKVYTYWKGPDFKG